MAAPIGPGDWVEYVGGEVARAHPCGVLTLGSLYLVVAIGIGYDLDRCPREGLKLRGFERTGVFAPSIFRPIYRPRADFIEALKAPVTRTPRPAKKSREDA